MIRKAIITAVLVVSIVLLIDGRVPKRYCDFRLEAEWGEATLLRETDNFAQRKPTPDEASRLRSTIRLCKHFTAEFDLTSSVVSEKDKWGTATLMTLAVELDDVSLLDQLASEGHSVNGLPNELNITTLSLATYRQMENAFYWSLENGVDPNLSDTYGNSPLMIAAMRPQDKLPSIQALLDAGAAVDSPNSDGWTALAVAIRHEYFKSAARLIEAGAALDSARAFLLDIATTDRDSHVNSEVVAILESLDNFLDKPTSE